MGWCRRGFGGFGASTVSGAVCPRTVSAAWRSSAFVLSGTSGGYVVLCAEGTNPWSFAVVRGVRKALAFLALRNDFRFSLGFDLNFKAAKRFQCKNFARFRFSGVEMNGDKGPNILALSHPVNSFYIVGS